MQVGIPHRLQIAIDALLTKPAVCSPEVRRAVTAYAGQKSDGTADPSSIPGILAPFVDKVSLHAYEVTDGDIEQLRAAGYSEDAIYEVTLCAAVGASLTRLECGLAALGGTD